MSLRPRVHVPVSPELALGLEECQRLLDLHLAEAVQRHGPGALGVIDLPALGPGQLVPSQIRASGVLYWTSEVEKAGLLPMIEALSRAVVDGTFLQPLGRAAFELTRLWRQRERRFSASERTALFQRIFGDGEGAPGFPTAFRSLVRLLVAVGRSPRDEGIGHLEARVAVAAQDVGSILSAGGVGIAGFAAREIVGQVREALDLLRDPDLERALGGGPPWQLVVRHAPAFLRRHLRPQRHLSLANAGLPIIGWIAAEAPAIESGSVRLGRAARVIREAEAWSAAYGEG